MNDQLLKVQAFLSSSTDFLGASRALVQDPEKGMSVLSAKYELLMEYCNNLCEYLRFRVKHQNNGNLPTSPLEEQPFCRDLIRDRVWIEKLSPIEAKLKHQIDRLLHASDSPSASLPAPHGACSLDSLDAMMFKPNPSSMIPTADARSLDIMEGDIHREAHLVEEDATEEKDGLYRPPKVAPMYFEEKASKSKDRKRREGYIDTGGIKTSKAALQHLREEYSEKPEELDDRTMLSTLEKEGKARSDDFESLDFASAQKAMLLERNSGKKKRKPKIRTMADELEDLFDISYSNDDAASDDAAMMKLLRKKSKMSRKKGVKEGGKASSEEISSGDDDEVY